MLKIVAFPIKAIFIALVFTAGAISCVFAADAAAPLIAAPSWVPAPFVPAWNDLVTTAALGWVLTHVRALLPNTGPWVYLNSVLDWVAGNYLNAKNVTKA